MHGENLKLIENLKLLAYFIATETFPHWKPQSTHQFLIAGVGLCITDMSIHIASILAACLFLKLVVLKFICKVPICNSFLCVLFGASFRHADR
jgi:hypothetical protein